MSKKFPKFFFFSVFSFFFFKFYTQKFSLLFLKFFGLFKFNLNRLCESLEINWMEHLKKGKWLWWWWGVNVFQWKCAPQIFHNFSHPKHNILQQQVLKKGGWGLENGEDFHFPAPPENRIPCFGFCLKQKREILPSFVMYPALVCVCKSNIIALVCVCSLSYKFCSREGKWNVLLIKSIHKVMRKSTEREKSKHNYPIFQAPKITRIFTPPKVFYAYKALL